MKLCTALILIFLTFAVNAAGQITYGEKRVVFTEEKRINLTTQRDTSYERFTPTLADIDSADAFFQKHLISRNKNTALKIQDYYRQYVGLKTKDKKCVFINAACKKPDDFLENTFLVFGGGDCYLQGDVDINNKKVFNFYSNAPM